MRPTVEDMDNISEILRHHLGHPLGVDDDGRRLGKLDLEAFTALEVDLLRYCTRLRYEVPAHQLIGGRR